MNTIRLTVNAIPPSNNKYLGNSHNFNEYRREKEKWRWLVRAALADAGVLTALWPTPHQSAAPTASPQGEAYGNGQSTTDRRTLNTDHYPLNRATVSITYHFSDRRRRDPDNYSGKFILDALVREGVIRDDSFDCVILRIEQGEPDRKRPHVDVEIREEHT